MKSPRSLAAAAAFLLLCAPPAFAHDDAYLATQKAPNGGQLRMAGPYHYELVMREAASGAPDDALAVYVTDHAGTPVPTQGAQGTVDVVAGNERSSVRLVPDGANRMKAVDHAPARAKDAALVVSITIVGAQPAQARFEPPAAGTPAPPHSKGTGTGHRH